LAKYKHLSGEERHDIEQYLNQQMSFKAIGRQLQRDPTTISKEVVGHIRVRDIGCNCVGFNACKKRNTCQKVQSACNPCKHPHAKELKCSKCGKCNYTCPEFREELCPKLILPPYVCNGCSNKNRCRLQKHYYYADFAQKEYETVKKKCRQGIAIPPEELDRIDGIVSPLLKQGQSLHHICVTHGDEIMLHERTIYRYLDNSLLDAGSLDLPRKVRYKKRKKNDDNSVKIEKMCYQGRTYQDFLKYVAENPDLPIVELDSVIGTAGKGKVLLTVFFRNCSMMLAFIREANTARSVADIINQLYETLGHELYCKMFPILLTDRGAEFTNPTAIECTSEGEVRSRMFYCDPQQAGQKGRCEVTHEMIRRVVPKGNTFKHFEQADVQLMMDHINSYTRKNLGNRSAYEVFNFLYGEDVLAKLNCTIIPADSITLKPRLLKKK